MGLCMLRHAIPTLVFLLFGTPSLHLFKFFGNFFIFLFLIYTLQMKCAVLQQKGTRFTKILASKAVSGFLPSHGWDDVKKKCLDAFGYHDQVPVDAKIIVGDCELQIDDSLPNLESLIKCRPSTKRGGIGVCLPPNEVHHCILHCMSM